MVSNDKTHSFGEVECAVCLMEDIASTGRERLPEALNKALENYGTAEIRLFVIGHLAPLAQAMMDLSYEDDTFDLWSFDWEVMPAFLRSVDWEKFDAYNENDWLPTPGQMMLTVFQQLNGDVPSTPKKPVKGRQLSL